MESCLVRIVDPKEIELLHPRLTACHQAAVREVERLSWDRALVILRERVERDDPQGDVPMTIYLNRAENPLPFARAWWDHLCEAHLAPHALSITAFAVSAYAVSVCHGLRGEDAEARRWMRVASETTEFEGRPGLCLVTYVRAMKLLAPVLRRLEPVP